MTDPLLSKIKLRMYLTTCLLGYSYHSTNHGSIQSALQLSKYRLSKTVTVLLHLLLKASLGLKLLFLASSHFLTFDRKCSM